MMMKTILLLSSLFHIDFILTVDVVFIFFEVSTFFILPYMIILSKLFKFEKLQLFSRVVGDFEEKKFATVLLRPTKLCLSVLDRNRSE